MVDQVFSDQAATLYTSYYLMQVMIYRPFTSYGPNSKERRKESYPNFPFPASTICINAAKACARIINMQMRRDFSNVTNLISASYLPAMLLMDAWKTDTKNRVQSDTTKESMSILDAISVLIEALDFAALRWDSAYYLL